MQNPNNGNGFIKPPNGAVNKTVRTALGRLQIKGPIEPEELSGCMMPEGLCCFRPSGHQHKALVELAGQPDGMVFTASLANSIVSYASFQKPDYPWWEKRCFPELIELGSIETDPSWRKMGLANTLLGSIFNDPDFTFFEDFIVIAFQFIHSWDLQHTGHSPWSYRRFMDRLFTKHGFKSFETNDPEVREHPCNVLMARFGKNISVADTIRFSGCCLGTNNIS